LPNGVVTSLVELLRGGRQFGLSGLQSPISQEPFENRELDRKIGAKGWSAAVKGIAGAESAETDPFLTIANTRER
jgi:hypothetical protein